MKNLIFTSLLFCVLISSCSVLPTDDEKIFIKVENVSEFDIEDLIIQETKFRDVHSGKTSRSKKVNPIMHEGFSNLYISFYGKVKESIIEGENTTFCWTEVRSITEGNYILEVDVKFNSNNIPRFDFNLIEG